MISRRIVLSLSLVGLTLFVSGCAGRDIGLREVRNAGSGPEEFGIVPTKPLEVPENLAALPTPTPGLANRSDQTPLQDSVAALGGNPARIIPQGGIPASDGAIVNAASRFGRSANIRETLAEEDLAFRKRKSLFTYKIVRQDEYNNAYRRLRIDPYRELARFRQAGVQTPAAPPRPR